MRKNYLILVATLLASLVLVSSVDAAPNTKFYKNVTIFLSDGDVSGELILKDFYLADYVKDNPEYLIYGINETFKGKATDITLEFENSDVIAHFKLNGLVKRKSDKLTFSLEKINTTLGFSEWAILYFDEFSIILSEKLTLLSLTPGPNRMNQNYFSWDWYNWDTDIVVIFSTDTKLSAVSAQIGPERKSPLIDLSDIQTERKVSSQAADVTTPNLEALSINSDSKFAVPGLEVYTGSDVVDGYTAQQWSEKYKPYFIYDVDFPDYGCNLGYDPTSHPASFYYRVVKGYDPYAQSNAIAIQYFVYWDVQPCPNHNYDYEHFWVWIDSWGSQPYRVVFSDWDPNDGISPLGDLPSVFRTHFKLEEGNGIKPISESTESKAWYPFGKELFTYKVRLEMVDSLDFHDTTHVWLRVPHVWHSFSANLDCGITDFCDEDERWYCPSGVRAYCMYDQTPLAMEDNTLKSWYNRYPYMNCRYVDWPPGAKVAENAPLISDVSDPFNHPLYWGRGDCDNPPDPVVDINSLSTSAEGNNLIATVSIQDEQTDAIQGLWSDRFSSYLDSSPLTLLSSTETSQGTYDLTFDISGKSPGTYTFDLYVYDNLDKYDTATDSVDIPGDTTPTFNWTESTDDLTGIDHYQIQVADNIDFSSPVIDKTRGSAYTYYTAPSGVLSSGVTYYWHVWAVDNSGNRGGNSTTWSFVIDTSCQDTAGPNTPSISSPSDGATITVETYTVNWGDVTDNGCAGMGGYEVKEAKSGGSTKTYPTGLTSEYDFSKSRSDNGDYTYRVRGVDAFGNYGNWSGAVSIMGEFE